MTSLRRKLTTTFIALGLLGLLVVGVTSYTVVQWRETEQQQARHYTRSLRLQEARALTFEAFKEVPDALLGSDDDARDDYQDRLAPIGAVFEEWASLAEDDAERAEVMAVREAAMLLDDSAEQVFDLAEAGDLATATAQLEQVEETAFEPFDALTTSAVATDRAKREQVRAAATEARTTATFALVAAGLGVVSLLLLVGAYLAGGVFGPVRALQQAMSRLAGGHSDTRLPEDGDDEIARINRDYNRLAARATLGPARVVDDREPDGAVEDARHLLERMVTGVHDDAAALHARVVTAADAGPDGGTDTHPDTHTDAGSAADAASALVAQVDAIRVALARMGSLAYPVDLDLAPVEPMALLHDVVDRVADEVVRRCISTRIGVGAGVGTIHADRARLRETLSELVRNALDALPRTGGSLELSADVDDAGWTVLEVRDDGSGLSEQDLAWLYDDRERPADTRGVGLKLATSLVEHHGGRLQLQAIDTGGTTARILLPPHPTNRGRHA